MAEERPGRPAWDEAVVGLDRMAPPDPRLGPRWFTGARLNFAENLLRYADDRDALVFWNEAGRQRALSYRELSRRWREPPRRSGPTASSPAIGSPGSCPTFRRP